MTSRPANERLVDYLITSGPTVWYSVIDLRDRYDLSHSATRDALLKAYRRGILQRRPARNNAYEYAAIAIRKPSHPPTWKLDLLDPFGRSPIPDSVLRVIDRHVSMKR